MRVSRLAFTLLTGLATASLIAPPARADEKGKHKESASWNFDSIGSWFEEMGEGFADTFSGPKRTAAPFKWSGKVAEGKTFEVRGINGPIRAVASNRSEVELVAIRSGRRNDPESVKIEVVSHAGGVTVCAVYPSRDESRPNVCKPGGSRMNVRNNDVNVEFELQIPKGVAFEGHKQVAGLQAAGVAVHADDQGLCVADQLRTRQQRMRLGERHHEPAPRSARDANDACTSENGKRLAPISW